MKDWVITILIIALGLTMYAATVRGVHGNPTGAMVKDNLDQATMPLELSPERGRYLLLLSLVEDRSFSLNKTLAMAAYPDIGWYEGKFYIFFAPGISLLAVPMYYLGAQYQMGQVAAFYTISIIATLTLVFLYKIGKHILKLPVWAAIMAPVIFGFATSSWSYAITMYQHHITAFCVTTTLYAAWKYKQNKKWSVLWSIFVWANLSLAVAVDYPNVALMTPVMLYFVYTWFKIRKESNGYKIKIRLSAVATSIVFIAYIAIQAYFNYTHFGGVTRVSNTLASYKAIVENEEERVVDTETANEAANNDRSAIKFFSEQLMPSGFTTLTVSLDRGVLLYAPILALGVLGIWGFVQTIDAEKSAILGSLGINFFLYSSWGDPWGGWAFGPRYLIPSMAMLALLAAYWISQKRFSFIRRLIAIVLIGYSTAVSLLGALTTNAVPPKIEADYLKMKYNFLLNYDFLQSDRSGSYLYNTVFSDHYTLIQYFTTLFITIMIVSYILLFLIPFYQSIKAHKQ